MKRGLRFTMDAATYHNVARLIPLRPQEIPCQAFDAVERIALDYDWPNAEDHQAWLNSAPADEIAAWVDTLWRDENAQQDDPEDPEDA